jgi:hypothetical protein
MENKIKYNLDELIELIAQRAIEDLQNEEGIELLAEPQYDGEEPPVIEKKEKVTIITLLNRKSEDERRRIFSKYGFYQLNHLIRIMDSISKASKGALKGSK